MTIVYCRNFDGTLGTFSVETNDYEEAMIEVFEYFIDNSIEPPKPILAIVR